ncbi:hypothetical protein V8B97DRAFT_2004053 [Scleroderma yunnanense]
MPDIASPSPRRACSSNTLQLPEMLSQNQQPLRTPPQPFLPLATRTFVAPPRLLSPITLREAPYIALNSKSPTPCSGSLKRRGTARVSRTARRRLHLPRIDYSLDVFRRPTIFDQLPWIATLDVPQNQGWDIADLSQIPLKDDFFSFPHSAPASGPVRHRKTSLRSNPLASATPTDPGADSPSLQPFPFHRSPICPKTPPPHVPFDPSRVTFYNLMPVFPHGANPDVPFLTPPDSY